MKRILLIIIFTISFLCSANAQWHLRRFNVNDIYNCKPAEFEFMWETVSRNLHRSAIVLGIGATCIVSGSIVVALSEPGSWVPSTGGAIGGSIVIVGILADCHAIPFTIVWANRKATLKTTPNYNALNLNTLNILPAIYRNLFSNTFSLGVTATLSF